MQVMGAALKTKAREGNGSAPHGARVIEFPQGGTKDAKHPACPRTCKFPRPASEASSNTELVKQYQDKKDPQLLEEIVSRNQGLLHAVLARFSYFPDPYEDLLQVANLGLIKAVQRFDPGRGAEFSSYATAVVDGEVRHYLRDNVLMRRPRWLRKLENQIEAASAELARKLKRPPTLKEISGEVNITEAGVIEVLKTSAAARLYPVDDLPEGVSSGHEPDAARIHSLHYESFALPVEDRIILEEALDALGGFHRKIIFLLFYRGLTQTEAAAEMGLSQRQVSRESARALVRLKAILNTKIF